MPKRPARIALTCIALIGPLASSGCFAEADPTAGPAGAFGEARSLWPGDAAPNPCGPLGDLRSAASCDGFTDYVACMSRECAAGFDICLGEGWTSGRYSGGSCETFMACIAGSADTCSHGCTPDGACQSCLSAQLSICETYCASLLDCAAAGPTTAGGACSALRACCDSHPEDLAALCLADLESARLDGDDGCRVLLGAYCIQ